MNYDKFAQIMNQHIILADLQYSLLTSVLTSPQRFNSEFQLLSAHDKLKNFLMTSLNIKFGYALEKITLAYLSELGFTALDNTLSNSGLRVDYLGIKDDMILLVEQKIRDDHDSSKRKGQVSNFIIKCHELEQVYSDNLHKVMWFIDDKFYRNKTFYHSMIPAGAHLFYGKEFFSFLGNDSIWDEFKQHLSAYRDKFTIPGTIDFSDAIKRLEIENKKLYHVYKKLCKESHSLFGDTA